MPRHYELLGLHWSPLAMKMQQFFRNVQCWLHWSSAWAFALFAEWRCSRIGAALKCKSLCKISRKTLTAEAQLLTFTIFTVIRKHSGQPYLPRAMHFSDLKFLLIIAGQCWVAYHIVGNFREGFIFAFFASQELFAKIKTAKFLLSTCKRANRVSIRPTSNYLSILTATEACQRVCLRRLSLKPSRKSKCYVSTDAQTERRHKGESGSNRFYERPGYEATFLATLEQRAEIAISLRRQL